MEIGWLYWSKPLTLNCWESPQYKVCPEGLIVNDVSLGFSGIVIIIWQLTELTCASILKLEPDIFPAVNSPFLIVPPVAVQRTCPREKGWLYWSKPLALNCWESPQYKVCPEGLIVNDVSLGFSRIVIKTWQLTELTCAWILKLEPDIFPAVNSPFLIIPPLAVQVMFSILIGWLYWSKPWTLNCWESPQYRLISEGLIVNDVSLGFSRIVIKTWQLTELTCAWILKLEPDIFPAWNIPSSTSPPVAVQVIFSILIGLLYWSKPWIVNSW